MGIEHHSALPTCLPPGLLRTRICRLRWLHGTTIWVEGDQNKLPERYSFRPITTFDRHYPTLGVVAWDELTDELAFNFVPGIFTEGRPLIGKLDKHLFFNFNNGSMIEFNETGDEAEYKTHGVLKGLPATRLYHHLERLTQLHAKKWTKAFPPEHHPDEPVKIKKRIR